MGDKGKKDKDKHNKQAMLDKQAQLEANKAKQQQKMPQQGKYRSVIGAAPRGKADMTGATRNGAPSKAAGRTRSDRTR